MDDNDVLWLYIGRAIPQRNLEEWFGVLPHHDRTPMLTLQTESSETAKKMENVIEHIR